MCVESILSLWHWFWINIISNKVHINRPIPIDIRYFTFFHMSLRLWRLASIFPPLESRRDCYFHGERLSRKHTGRICVQAPRLPSVHVSVFSWKFSNCIMTIMHGYRGMRNGQHLLRLDDRSVRSRAASTSPAPCDCPFLSPLIGHVSYTRRRRS